MVSGDRPERVDRRLRRYKPPCLEPAVPVAATDS